MASPNDNSLRSDDPRDPPAPMPPTPAGEPPVEEPDETPPTREEPAIGDLTAPDAPMIA